MRQVFLVGVLVVGAGAQISTGPLVGLPVTFVVGSNDTRGPGPTVDGRLLPQRRTFLKRAGFTALIDTPSGAPDFTMAALFAGLSPLPTGFRLDAVSSQYNGVWADPVTGMVTVPPWGGWSALAFSVTRDTPGGDAPVVVQEHGRAEGCGGDVFTFFLPGSDLSVLPACAEIGMAERANDSAEMGFRATLALPELGDFDPFFPAYESGIAGGALDPDPWFFFSLPHSFASTTPDPTVQSWFQTRGTVPVAHPTPSGATILHMRWNHTIASWSTPDVFATYAELGLDVDDDIDALAIDAGGRLLLSLRRTPIRNQLGHQLMVAGFTLHPAPTPPTFMVAQPLLYDPGTDGVVPVAKIAGAGGTGDIDAVCELDPGNGGPTPWVLAYLKDCRSDVPFPTTMHGSVFATASPPGSSSYSASVSGLPVTFGVSLYGLLLGFPGPNGANLPLGSAVTLTVGVASSPTLTVPWSIPLPQQGGLWGAQMDFQWAATDGNSVSLSRLLRIRL